MERNYIDIWGSGDSPPEASNISKKQIKWKPDIFFFLLFGSAPEIPKSMCLLPSSPKIISSAPQLPENK